MSIPKYTYALLAAHNNAHWCDTVCATHGTPGAFDASVWVCHHPTPRFYPNVVTLSPDDLSAQRHAVERLRQSLPGSWAVKDSFATLDLAPLGFMQLFEAEWIWRPADVQPPIVRSNLQWTRISDAEALESWEQAWVGEDDGSVERIFLPPLLHDPNVAIIAARQDERIVGGVIANRTNDVVGLSNLFAPTGMLEHGWPGAISAIAATFPGLPMVGYESGNDLAMAEQFGFERVGPLRVYAC
jgi:hypothetical protein